MPFNEFTENKKRMHLTRGLHCKACDKPIEGDPELCSQCLQIARSLFADVDKPDEEEFIDLTPEVQTDPDPE